ncbi:hypothetical protein FO519_009099 [Halicephalobus sp. NKZ332]|nr:hypothetical protein FO519_009099 [Halicephalobus sp. NKZ332]
MSEEQFFERVVCKPLALGHVAYPTEKLRDDALPGATHFIQEPELETPAAKQEKTKPWDDKRPLFMWSQPSRRSQIVVVNAAGQPAGDPKDDDDLKRLKEIQKFLPLLKGCLPGYRDGVDIYKKIDPKPFIRFTHRFQTHLAICAQVVSAEQSKVFSGIVQMDQAMTSVTAKLTQNSRQIDKLCDELRKVKDLQERLDAVELLLQEIVPTVEILNELLPENDRLPPLCLIQKPSYSSIGHSSPSTPALSALATSPEDSSRIEPAEECKMNREPDLSFIQSDIPLSEVRPLEQKKLALLINEFLTRTADIMNSFSANMENNLLKIEERLDSLEIGLQLAEKKLSTIEACPDEPIPSITAKVEEVKEPQVPVVLDQVQDITNINVNTTSTTTTTSVTQPQTTALESLPGSSEVKQELTPIPGNMVKISDHPSFSKYFKMLRLGVPDAGVRQKMIQEGVDPNLLSDPNKLLPIKEEKKDPTSDEESDDSDSDSSFSSD